MLEVAVASSYGGLLEFEGGYVGYDVDFVVGVHVSAGAVCARVADLDGGDLLAEGYMDGLRRARW